MGFSNAFIERFHKQETEERDDGTCVWSCEFEVDAFSANGHNMLHGGAIASIIDIATTYAIVAIDARAMFSVSVDMHISYLAAAPLGSKVQVEAFAEKVGRNLAFTSCTLSVMHKGNRRLVARGRHTKFIGAGPPKSKL